MFKIKSQVEFDTAHYLSGYIGKCSNIHGHRYKLIAKIKSEKLHKEGQLRGMVDDFGNFKNALKEIAEGYDHKFKIVFVPYRPTAEEMSREIFNKLKAKGFKVYEVELFETPNNSCIYTEE